MLEIIEGILQQQDAVSLLSIPNLLTHWKFDDASGTTAVDSGPNTLNATTSGSPTWGTGQHAGCLNFDGVNDYANVADNALLDFGASQNFSVCIWLKTSTAAVSAIYPFVVSKRNITGATPDSDWAIMLAGLGEGYTMYSEVKVGGTAYTLATNETIRDGNWHHIVFQRDGTTLRLYHDGAVPTGGTSTNASISGSLANASPVRFGELGFTGFEYWFTGSMDDCRMYTRAITQTEVTALYNGTAA